MVWSCLRLFATGSSTGEGGSEIWRKALLGEGEGAALGKAPDVRASKNGGAALGKAPRKPREARLPVPQLHEDQNRHNYHSDLSLKP